MITSACSNILTIIPHRNIKKLLKIAKDVEEVSMAVHRIGTISIILVLYLILYLLDNIVPNTFIKLFIFEYCALLNDK